jgi:carbon monoxide dehydrogenase subunit G
MTRFTATTESEAIVPADRMAIWRALTDPELLPRLTPLLRRVDADGDIWTWHMARISALGVSISPSFTERMDFAEGSRIGYTHTPPRGTRERAGAEGWYELSDVDGGTVLKISLTLGVELPLPRSATPAVRRVMQATMNRMGDRFSANLLRHLGVESESALSA